MIYSNNYAWPGVTAIIYNLELEENALGFSLPTVPGNLDVRDNTGVTELGIQYKKTSDSSWETLKISDETRSGAIVNGSLTFNAFETGDKEVNGNRVLIYNAYRSNIAFIPIRIVLRNLQSSTSYDIRSYYKISGTLYYYNSTTISTIAPGIIYNCTDIIVESGRSEPSGFRNNLNTACQIYNEMTAFTAEYSKTDHVGSLNNGEFTVTSGSTAGAATSDMIFNTSFDVHTICHEMAHNLMYHAVFTGPEWSNGIDTNADVSVPAKEHIVKFMEFATHWEGAYWRWTDNQYPSSPDVGGHCFPVITSVRLSLTYQYLVAAACYACRMAGINE